MRERVEFPISLDAPPSVREPVGFKNQKDDDDDPDRHLAQEGDVVLQSQKMVDRQKSTDRPINLITSSAS